VKDEMDSSDELRREEPASLLPFPQARGQSTVDARPYTMVKQRSNRSGSVAHMRSDFQATSNADDSGMAHVSDIVESLMLEENPSITSMNWTVEGHGTFQAMLSDETCKKLMMILRTPLETDLRPRDFARQYTSREKSVANTQHATKTSVYCTDILVPPGHGEQPGLPNKCWYPSAHVAHMRHLDILSFA
jgi:hypothetical protein